MKHSRTFNSYWIDFRVSVLSVSVWMSFVGLTFAAAYATIILVRPEKGVWFMISSHRTIEKLYTSALWSYSFFDPFGTGSVLNSYSDNKKNKISHIMNIHMCVRLRVCVYIFCSICMNNEGRTTKKGAPREPSICMCPPPRSCPRIFLL